MKVKDIVTLINDLQVILQIGTARFTNDKLFIPKGSRVQIDDIFQGECKIQQLESPFINTWVTKKQLQANSDA